MDAFVFGAVLLAALLHAIWNALAKARGAEAGGATLIGIGAGVLALPGLFVLPLPARASWPALAASAVVHVAYFRLVGAAYREGALSAAYPLMRGVPPLLVGFLSVLFLGDTLSAHGWLAILALAGGVAAVAGEGFGSRAISRRGALVIAANVLVIVAYTLIDGHGVRAAANAPSYAAWMFALTALGLLPWLERRVFRAAPAHWARLALGALCTVGSYGIALWAMTRAPIALVASLRETSVLFAAALAALLLKERFGLLRWTAVTLTLAGIAAMRLA